MTAGDRIFAARNRANMSRNTLALKAKTSYMNLWRIETGRQQPSLAALTKLAAALNVEPGELLRSDK
jgi:transcriptional regulator with XRE-family HTH domain